MVDPSAPATCQTSLDAWRSSSDTFALVSSFYGPGALACWLLSVLSTAISWGREWTADERPRLITPDFIAAVAFPAVAAGHMLVQLGKASSSEAARAVYTCAAGWGGVSKQSVVALDGDAEAGVQLAFAVVVCLKATVLVTTFTPLALVVALKAFPAGRGRGQLRRLLGNPAAMLLLLSLVWCLVATVIASVRMAVTERTAGWLVLLNFVCLSLYPSIFTLVVASFSYLPLFGTVVVAELAMHIAPWNVPKHLDRDFRVVVTIVRVIVYLAITGLVTRCVYYIFPSLLDSCLPESGAKFSDLDQAAPFVVFLLGFLYNLVSTVFAFFEMTGRRWADEIE